MKYYTIPDMVARAGNFWGYVSFGNSSLEKRTVRIKMYRASDQIKYRDIDIVLVPKQTRSIGEYQEGGNMFKSGLDVASQGKCILHISCTEDIVISPFVGATAENGSPLTPTLIKVQECAFWP